MTPLPGLCSVTFRQLAVGEIVELAADSNLECIEWGGDVHVPHGDIPAAEEAARQTRAGGLSVSSYGSYLFADEGARSQLPDVVATAEALGAPSVRVWAPFGVEPGCDPRELDRTAAALHEICSAAATHDLEVYLEFHGGTLTASAPSAVELMVRADAPNLRCGWQPPYWAATSLQEELDGITSLSDRLGHIHVYSWLPDGTRCALDTEQDRWPRRLAASLPAAQSDRFRRVALLEFLPGDDPAALGSEASTLISWLDGAAG